MYELLEEYNIEQNVSRCFFRTRCSADTKL